ncbi:MAG: glycosyl hydrolase family protein [Verrucomicrobia bacterium]|nr:MAG: glycosyl hydrolase family protein [Verrucomicrobiota bacterium]TAE88551.1 MAG: glycosyl hydrolase family protein [Verrucomicrobiota bacterium]TAF27006.1 MAG: glycosyl hydrolase family protein [Verrucomicrobiota bacterium]TAF42262.1 MAG: glycosyl hydrolase family protein [Verrucomicrobiota bacterium]
MLFHSATTLLPIALGFAVVAMTSARLPAATPTGAGWTLAWNDEFEGSTIDTAKWRHWLPGARRDAVNSPSAVAVADGALAISTYTSGGTHYTGMLSTQDTYPYTYGYIEARIDYDSSPGMWSAFWMQSPTMGNPIGSPNSAGTEIDICEHRKVDGSGTNRDGNVGGVIHWDGYGADHKSHGYDSGNLGLGTGYHIYGMEWTPTQQKFYIDGVLRWTINNAPNTPVSQRSEFIILSSEVDDTSTTWAGPIPAGGYGTLATTTTKMKVDYVRVYRRSETVVNGDFEGKIGPFSASGQATWSATGGRNDPAAAKIAPTSGGSSVEQSVRGLLPDTAYQFNAWGNAGTTSPGLLIAAKNYGGSQTGQTLSSATYTQASVPFTTGSNNRSATVLAHSANIGSTAYVDDFQLRRAASVPNGHLEHDASHAWTSSYGGAIVSGDSTYDGEFAWKIPASSSSAGVEQDIVGLTPSTAYRLSGWTTNGNTSLSFGVKNHGASQVTSAVSSNIWARATVNFTTGSASTTATVFAFRPSSAQTAYADSFFLHQPLAAPWASADLTTTGRSGIAGRLGDRLVLQAGGNNLGGSNDAIHFLHQPLNGDGTITARLVGVDTTAYHAKAGLMIRESTAPGARSASVVWGPVNQLVEFNRRTTGNASASSTLTPRDIVEPPWLRLTRRGNTFTAYRSPDGQSWTRVGSPQTIAMSANALVGIPACAGDTTRLTEVAVDDVSITAPIADVSITSPADGSTLSGTGQALHLTATVSSTTTPTLAWSMVSGPGSVSFVDPNLATTSATFSATGSYVLRLTATTAAGSGSADLTVHVASAPVPDASLVLHLKLDESSGTIASDSSGSANHGTATGGFAWQPASGAITGAADFNGTDSYFAVPDSASLDNTAAFTLSYWFRAETLGNNTGLVAKRVGPSDNNSYGFFLGLDGKLSVDVNSSNNRFTSNTTFNSGRWYHIALVFDGSLAEAQRAKLYVNGALDTTAAETSSSVPNHASQLYVGVLAPGSAVFDGLIDEVRFHRRALSGTEVAALESATDNFAPTVATGPAPAAIPGIAANLTGSAGIDAGPSPTVVWSKVGGPGNAIFANPSSASTTVTFDQAGTYLLRLTASSPGAQTSADLSVTAAYPPPLLAIVDPPAPVALADAADALRLIVSTDANGAPGSPTIAWSQFSGPAAVIFDDPSAADTRAHFSAPGSYLLRCTATGSGGSTSADVSVTIATPASLSLRQGENSYNHAATFLRSDVTTWNSGARDQLVVGKSASSSNFFRSVLSFPLTGVPANATLTAVSLDVWTHPTQAGTSSVAALELRAVAATPVEGSGTSSDANNINGTGTGATWLNRSAATAWTSPGGDFGPTVLSTLPGFNAATTAAAKNFPSSSAFLATTQAALAAGQPLNLMLISPLTESGPVAAFTRLASDDHPTVAQRPRLSLIWSVNPAPAISSGPAPNAITGTPAALTGNATGADSTTWIFVSGPGSASFASPDNPATSVTFSQAGSYLLRLIASNSNGEVSRDLSVEVRSALDPASFEDWQELTWQGVVSPQIIGPDADPDRDGLTNLIEWALHLDAMVPGSFDPDFAKNGALLDFTYTRRKIAPGEAEFQVEWSDSLNNAWSSSGVAETRISQTPETETMEATIPAGLGRRFVRLNVRRP